MPMVKLPKKDMYLIGTESKQLTVKGENCMVRVGGGYVTIDEYYNKYATKQCVALYAMMTNRGQPFLDTIADLMRANGVSDEQLQSWYGQPEFETANTLFIMLATLAEEKTKNVNETGKGKKRSPLIKGRSGINRDL